MCATATGKTSHTSVCNVEKGKNAPFKVLYIMLIDTNHARIRTTLWCHDHISPLPIPVSSLLCSWSSLLMSSCLLRFTLLSDVTRHLSVHSAEPAYSCLFQNCTYKARSVTALNRHIRLVRNLCLHMQRGFNLHEILCVTYLMRC